TAPAGTGTFSHHPVEGCRYYRVSAVNTSGYGGGYADEDGSCVAGQDLIPPTVTVVYPNGGEEIETGDTVYVEWIATDNRWVDSVSIYFSENAGASYELLAHSEPNDSTFMWETPSMLSDSCLIWIVAYDPGTLTGDDVSDSLFCITLTTGDGEETPGYVCVLEQNYPNPFNPVTKIAFSNRSAGNISLRIYDTAGRLVRTLIDGWWEVGRHETIWDGRDNAGRAVTSGVYFCRFRAGVFTSTRKMVLLR
ncbi:MAG: T9SS type A sorting domain-containing protein, partial [bacterium]